MVKIIPAILSADINEVKSLIARAEGVVDRVQVDIIDGTFAENKTIDPIALYNIETDLLLDFHLMVKEPKSWVEKCVRAGADRIIGQIEMMESQVNFVSKVQEMGVQIGLALDLATPVLSLDTTILNNVDTVLVMSVKAGFGGQEFDEKALSKIEVLDEVRSRDRTPFSIIDDGGISFKNVDDTKRAGADEVAIGRRLFEGDLRTNIEKFKQALGTSK